MLKQIFTNTATNFKQKLLINIGKGVVDGCCYSGDESNCGSKTQSYQHQEEEDCKELRNKVKLGQNFRITDKSQSSTRFNNFIHGQVEFMSEVAEDGEDDGARQQGGEGVGEADDEGVLVGVVSELVVRAVGRQGTKPHTEGEERLSNCCIPNLSVLY